MKLVISLSILAISYAALSSDCITERNKSRTPLGIPGLIGSNTLAASVQ